MKLAEICSWLILFYVQNFQIWWWGKFSWNIVQLVLLLLFLRRRTHQTLPVTSHRWHGGHWAPGRNKGSTASTSSTLGISAALAASRETLCSWYCCGWCDKLISGRMLMSATSRSPSFSFNNLLSVLVGIRMSSWSDKLISGRMLMSGKDHWKHYCEISCKKVLELQAGIRAALS